VARFAHLYDVPIRAAEAEVRLVIDRREKLGLEGPGSAAQSLSIRLRIESPAPREAVAGLARYAERSCHGAQSLIQTVPVLSEAYHNGERILPD
jgi:hypothetical protein